MERSFLAGLGSGGDRSWLPLPSTVELWGFPSTGSRASSSAAQLNSASPGTRGWFELCPAMGRGEMQPGEESSPLLPPPPEARGEQGWQLLLLGNRHHSFTAFCSRSHRSSSPNECEHHAAAGAARLAFQVSALPTAACEDVATVTVCPHLPFAHRQRWSLQSS